MAYEDRTHQQWEQEAERTGAAALGRKVYHQYTGRYDEQEVADKIMAALRKRGYEYTLSARVAWGYAQ